MSLSASEYINNSTSTLNVEKPIALRNTDLPTSPHRNTIRKTIVRAVDCRNPVLG
jgi:hypothetical protein